MRDPSPGLSSSHLELTAEPECCPGGAHGPIFETPLLELAFNRLRDLVRRPNTANVAPIAADPSFGQLPIVATLVAAPPLLRKDASHDR